MVSGQKNPQNLDFSFIIKEYVLIKYFIFDSFQTFQCCLFINLIKMPLKVLQLET